MGVSIYDEQLLSICVLVYSFYLKEELLGLLPRRVSVWLTLVGRFCEFRFCAATNFLDA